MRDELGMDSDHHSDRGRDLGSSTPWAVICRLTKRHDWIKLSGHGDSNFRVCSRCGETGWLV